MQLIYRASNITEAHIVAGLLKSNGIEAHVGGHYLQGGVGELAPFNFANVHVADEDVTLAKTIIAEYEGQQNAPVTNQNRQKNTSSSKLLIAIFVFLFILFIYYLVA